MKPTESMCRVCLVMNNSNQQFNWNSFIDGIDEKLSYIECFQRCTHLNTKLESCTMNRLYHLCKDCVIELKGVYKFICKAQKSDKLLRLDYAKSDSTTTLKPFEWIALEKEEPDAFMQTHDSLDVIFDIKIKNAMGEGKSQSSNDVELPAQQDKQNDDETCKNTKPKVCKINKSKKNQLNCSSRRASKRELLLDKKERTQVVCEICNKTMTYTQLRPHMSYHNRGNLLCKSCPRTFKDLRSLNQHELIHEKNRERKYTCEQCGRKFYTNVAYQNHLKIHDPSRVALYTCDKCGKSFLFKGSLTLHKKKHAGGTLECNICHKRYVRIFDLRTHQRSHTGDLPFTCTKCDKSFTVMSSLKRHLRQHEDRRYKCDTCGKEYETYSTLHKHNMEHTGFPLKCTICDKGFPDMYKMRRHIRGVHKLHGADEMDKHIIKFRKPKCVEEIH